MSLQLLAKQMEAKGRKGDSMLVHMTAKEVAALQKMAESAGGSLSVNPETGLVEANFLKRMLPTLVGIGVGAATMNPYLGAAAGAAVGGYQAQRNDQDVLLGAAMGGLGGYGGAGLGAGLTAAGGTTAANVAADAAARTAAEEAAKQAALEQATQQAAQQATEQSAQALLQEQTKNQLIGAATPDITMSGIAPPNLAAQYGATNAGMTPMPATVQPMPVSSVAAPKLTASESLSRAGEGIGQLATKEGRTAFGGEFGFGSASAGLAPLMAAGKRPEDPEADDEMYSYTYDPGYTGAERTPSGSSAERRYFDGRFSPVRKIRARDYAAKGGLMSLAEGGETAAPAAAEVAAPALGMPGGIGEPTAQVVVYGPDGTMYPTPAHARAAGVANYTMQQPVLEANRIIPRMPDSGSTNTAPSSSEAALAYLMGERSSSAPARSPLIDAQLMQGRPAPTAQAPVVGSDNMYAFDPATGTFLRNPGVPGAESSGSPVGTSFAGGDGYQPVAPNPDFDTPEKQAAYYRENPTMGAITRAGQKALSFTPMSMFARAVAPEYMAERARTAQSITYGGDGGGYAADRGMGSEVYGDMPAGTYASGGLMGLAKGGMASGGFVVPADVVSALGNGSTDAGLRKLSAMMGDVKPIKGKGDGLSDSIPTNIDGKQPARVADGEAYIDPKTVKRLGGAKKLYAMMDKIRAQAHGKTTQQRKVNPARVMA